MRERSYVRFGKNIAMVFGEETKYEVHGRRCMLQVRGGSVGVVPSRKRGMRSIVLQVPYVNMSVWRNPTEGPSV